MTMVEKLYTAISAFLIISAIFACGWCCGQAIEDAREAVTWVQN